jgi:hypothetical protein
LTFGQKVLPSYRAFYDATACERHTTRIGMSLLLAEQLLLPLLRA